MNTTMKDKDTALGPHSPSQSTDIKGGHTSLSHTGSGHGLTKKPPGRNPSPTTSRKPVGFAPHGHSHTGTTSPSGSDTHLRCHRRQTGVGHIPKLPPKQSLTSDIHRPALKSCQSMSVPRKGRASSWVPHHHHHVQVERTLSSLVADSGSIKHLPVKMDAETSRDTLAKITFSLSQQSHVLSLERSFANLPDNNFMKCGHRFKPRLTTTLECQKMSEEGDEILGVPMGKEFKDFQRDFYRRLEEAAIKRKSLRIRKRWLKAYRKVQSVLKIGKNLAQRSRAFEQMPSTYVDIGDSTTIPVDYGVARSIDTRLFKRKKETSLMKPEKAKIWKKIKVELISISAQVSETLTSNPPDRTLLQLEEARRELQKVQVFSEYPLNVQEQLLRRAFYLTIGPQRVVLRQGHVPVNCFVVICGEAYVKQHVWDEERGEMVAKAVAFIKTGDTFGSISLIRGENRKASVISRTNMQLLAINGDDYLDLIFRRALPDELPPHIQYLSEMNFMENFPISLLKEKLSACGMHHFRRNTVITDDSRKCHSLFIIKYGYCKVFRKLQNREKVDADQEVTMSQKKKRGCDKMSSTVLLQNLLQDQHYIERDSPYVSYMEMLSPAGHTLRVPVTKLPGRRDRMYNQPLTLPPERRQFVPLMLLREGEVFGLDQTPLCPSRAKSRPTILVSLGAEVIALNKDLYCRHAAKEAMEVAEKTFIYDDVFIQRRLRERVNRDVHLEEVLKHYFLKVAQLKSEITKIALFEDPL